MVAGHAHVASDSTYSGGIYVETPRLAPPNPVDGLTQAAVGKWRNDGPMGETIRISYRDC